jgi:hypothetical protein
MSKETLDETELLALVAGPDASRIAPVNDDSRKAAPVLAQRSR